MLPISIIICCFNQQATIAQAIEGIIAQHIDVPYELIIGDDASTDNTVAICKSFQQLYPDRIKLLLWEKNLGSMQNFKHTVLATSGNLMAFCAGDDYWSDPYKLQKQYQFLLNNPGVAFVHTRYKVLHIATGEITEEPYPVNLDPTSSEDILLKSNFVGALTVMIRADIVRQAAKEGLFDKGFLMEDYPLWIYATENMGIGFINEFTAVWRKNEESLSNTKNIKRGLQFANSIIQIRQYFATQRNLQDQIAFSLRMAYKQLQYSAFINGEEELATESFRQLRLLGERGIKYRIYGHKTMQPLFRFLKKVIGK